jgi:hypothetical protein
MQTRYLSFVERSHVSFHHIESRYSPRHSLDNPIAPPLNKNTITNNETKKKHCTTTDLQSILEDIWKNERKLRLLNVAGDISKLEYNEKLEQLLSQHDESVPSIEQTVRRSPRPSPRVKPENSIPAQITPLNTTKAQARVTVSAGTPSDDPSKAKKTPCSSYEPHAWKDAVCRNCNCRLEEHQKPEECHTRTRILRRSTFKHNTGCSEFEKNFWAPHLCMNCGISRERHSHTDFVNS